MIGASIQGVDAIDPPVTRAVRRFFPQDTAVMLTATRDAGHPGKPS